MAELIDRRQRLAACMLMTAIKLPAPADEICQAWLQAAKILPGVNTGEIHAGDRIKALHAARALVDELIVEAEFRD